MTDDATKMKQERDLALAECERLRADMKKLRKSLESIVDNDTYETEYDGRMYTHCHSCNYDSDKPSTAKHDATCDYVLARKVMAAIDAARAKP